MVEKNFKYYLNKSLNYNLWVFNLILFSVGIYVVTFNIDKFKDCDHILITIILGIVNNGCIFLGCSVYIQILNFFTNTTLFIYNIYNITSSLDINCKTYIKDNYSLMWYFYIIQIYFQMFALINYIFKFILYNLREVNDTEKDKDTEKQQLIYN
jgi:hypothetical protein